MITITWRPLGLKAEQDIDGYVDVVTWVQWSCFGIDLADSGTYTAEEVGEITLPFTPSNNFIPMSQLTDAIVNEWVWDNGVDKAAVEAAVIANIEAQKQ
jgi:hypothetical protein